jgi:hypothetical protein
MACWKTTGWYGSDRRGPQARPRPIVERFRPDDSPVLWGYIFAGLPDMAGGLHNLAAAFDFPTFETT